jgi:hypothetical protein
MPAKAGIQLWAFSSGGAASGIPACGMTILALDVVLRWQRTKDV